MTTTITDAPPARRTGSLAGDARFALLTALALALFPLLLHPSAATPAWRRRS